MNLRKFAVALPLLLLAVFVSSPVLAQGESNGVGQGFGDFYVSAAPDRYEPVIDLPINTPTPVYLLAFVDYTAIGAPDQNEFNGVGAWEARVTVPASVLVIGNVLNPGTALNVVTPIAPNLEYQVGTGSLIPAENGIMILATLTLLATSEISGADITVAPIANPSLAGEVVWVDFQPFGSECFSPTGPITCIRAFDVLGGATINPEPVADDARSFGNLKSRF